MRGKIQLSELIFTTMAIHSRGSTPKRLTGQNRGEQDYKVLHNC